MHIPSSSYNAGPLLLARNDLLILLLPLLILLTVVLYILSLKLALERRVPVSRTMAPESLWYLLIPLVGNVWALLRSCQNGKIAATNFAIGTCQKRTYGLLSGPRRGQFRGSKRVMDLAANTALTVISMDSKTWSR